tara:strand:- start:203 stop:661 length:459 start_codon:yes stop_codon:yes gene_type:complete
MASGREHDKAIKIWTVPLGILISIIFNARIGLCFSIAFLLGGLWLSPDLDTLSIPLKRWGLLQFLWWPYRKFIKHRSWLSHGIFIGTTMRLVYLIGIITIFSYAIEKIFNLDSINLLNNIKQIYDSSPKEIFGFLVGIEASAWIHLIKDTNN